MHIPKRSCAGLMQSKRSNADPFVVAIRRFSQPPVLSDLDALALDDVDLEGIRRCQKGDCSVKLAAHEIESLKKAAETGGDWKAAVQREFRRLVFSRVTTYQTEGLAGLSAVCRSR